MCCCRASREAGTRAELVAHAAEGGQKERRRTRERARAYLSSVATIALLVVFDDLLVQHAAGRASRGGAWGLLDDLVAAAVGVYYFGAHGNRPGGGGGGGEWVWWGSLELFWGCGLGRGNSRAQEWLAEIRKQDDAWRAIAAARARAGTSLEGELRRIDSDLAWAQFRLRGRHGEGEARAGGGAAGLIEAY